MPPSLPSPRSLYRSYLAHLRYIPDPHVWATLAPRFKALLRESSQTRRPLSALVTDDDGNPSEAAETSVAGAARNDHRREKEERKVLEQLKELRQAVACHPHALRRLLEKCYARRGRVKWELVKTITLSSPLPDPEALPRYPPSLLQPLPGALQPLKPPPVPPSGQSPRARQRVPPSAVRREARKVWERDWASFVGVPLILPPNAHGAQTGWENTGIVESLRMLAHLDSEPVLPPPPRRSKPPSFRVLPPPIAILPTLARLAPSLRAAFPRQGRHGSPPDPYPRPPPKETRKNPRTWSEVHTLTPRLLRRTYRQLWDGLVWVRPRIVGRSGKGEREGTAYVEKWEKCPFVGLEERGSDVYSGVEKHKYGGKAREMSKYSLASEEDAQWVLAGSDSYDAIDAA